MTCVGREEPDCLLWTGPFGSKTSVIGNYKLPMWCCVRGSVSRTAAIAAVPVVAGTLSESAAVVGTVAFWTNTWRPWSFIVANRIA